MLDSDLMETLSKKKHPQRKVQSIKSFIGIWCDILEINFVLIVFIPDIKWRTHWRLHQWFSFKLLPQSNEFLNSAYVIIVLISTTFTWKCSSCTEGGRYIYRLTFQRRQGLRHFTYWVHYKTTVMVQGNRRSKCICVHGAHGMAPSTPVEMAIIAY